jgi:2',3'-cyclic-nucleotide 3'-phosphodiesterase
MPGSSLWLLPPADHPLSKVLPALIDKTSKQFGSPHRFLPHVTLTSEISPSTYGPDAQAWLDSLGLVKVENDVRVNFECLGSEDVFFRKLYIKCEMDDGLKRLARQCRRHVQGFKDEKKAEDWAKDKYMPHLSLM